MQALASLLADGLTELQVEATPSQQLLLLDFLNLLKKWNRAYNLVADATDEVLLYRHLLDSIAIAPHLDANCVLDVGSGGGFPGIPLAILKPHCRFILLDSNGKKTRFLFQTAVKLGLKNVAVENNRVEKFSPADKFAIVTSRAFASLDDMVKGCAHLLADKGEFWAMKGLYPEDELADCADKTDLKQVYKLTVPHSDGERHLVILKNR